MGDVMLHLAHQPAQLGSTSSEPRYAWCWSGEQRNHGSGTPWFSFQCRGRRELG